MAFIKSGSGKIQGTVSKTSAKKSASKGRAKTKAESGKKSVSDAGDSSPATPKKKLDIPTPLLSSLPTPEKASVQAPVQDSQAEISDGEPA